MSNIPIYQIIIIDYCIGCKIHVMCKKLLQIKSKSANGSGFMDLMSLWYTVLLSYNHWYTDWPEIVLSIAFFQVNQF